MNWQPLDSRNWLLPAGLIVAGFVLGAWCFQSDSHRIAAPVQREAAAELASPDEPDEDRDWEPPLPDEPQARYKALPERIRAYERSIQRLQADVSELKRKNENLEQRIINLEKWADRMTPDQHRSNLQLAGLLQREQLENIRILAHHEELIDTRRSRVERLKEEYEDLRIKFESASPGKRNK